MASSLSWQLQPPTDTSLDNAVYHRTEAAVAKEHDSSVLFFRTITPTLISAKSYYLLGPRLSPSAKTSFPAWMQLQAG